MLDKDTLFQARACVDREDDIPGDVLGALVKERISKKDCADNVSFCCVLLGKNSMWYSFRYLCGQSK